MQVRQLQDRLAEFPVIAAIRDDKWQAALESPAQVLFYLDARLMTVHRHIEQAHLARKAVFVHMDLAEGIGKDREGIRYLSHCGADGILSTRANIIRMAKEEGLLTVQRFFALDSQGMDSVKDMLHGTSPHFMEIMPGVLPKAVRRFSSGSVPVIAGGLIETKGEITAALGAGAAAISTGCEALWYL